MIANTSAGGRVICNVIDGIVFLGIDGNGGTRRKYSSYALTPTEARNVSNWLQGAATQAENDPEIESEG
jgi:hypothetical protein